VKGRPGRPNRRGAWRITRGLLAGLAVALIAAVALAPALGYRTLVVQSGSMGRAAPTGSLVLARPLRPADVQVNDVVLLQSTDGATRPPVLHRVIDRRVDADGRIVVRTKGDANATADPSSYTLTGTTLSPVLVIPRLGHALGVLRSPVAWYGLVMVPAILLSAGALCRIWAPDGPAPAHLARSRYLPRSGFRSAHWGR